MKIKSYFLLMSRIFIICLVLFGWGCDKVAQREEQYPLGPAQFSFLQASGKLFISVPAAANYQGSKLSSLNVLWMGTDSTTLTADTLDLNDEGKLGDIILEDDIYSLKFVNGGTLNNILFSSDKDYIYFDILAVYGNTELIQNEAFLLGNIRPRIISVWTPDTISRPSVNPDPNIINTVEFPVTCSVDDANGIDDIRLVQFRSYHTGLDSFMNGGNPIHLLDDGSAESGDNQKGDGTFTITPSLTESAVLGTYEFIFQAVDFSDAYSDTVVRVIVIK